MVGAAKRLVRTLLPLALEWKNFVLGDRMGPTAIVTPLNSYSQRALVMADIWEERKKGLEEAFFTQRDQDLLEKLRKQYASQDLIASLQEISGITDRVLLQKLVDSGVNAPVFTALVITPLVEVAWADGQIDNRERAAILDAAVARGVAKGTPAFEWLERMLNHRPEIAVIAAWREYVREISKTLSPELRAAAKRNMVARCKQVAEAAGGILGFNKISATEQAVIDDLSRAYDV